MKKRILYLVLALVLLCVLIPQLSVSARADAYSGTCGDGLEWDLDTADGTLIIKGIGDMTNYSAQGERVAPWSNYSGLITKLDIRGGVKSIGTYAFSNCSLVTEVVIPNTVTDIRANAFYNCYNLEKLDIPSSVTSIDSQAFIGCDGLKTVSIDTKNIRNTWFRGSMLTNLTLGPNVETIADLAFEGCQFLQSVKIGAKVHTINSGAFDGCTALASEVGRVDISDLEAWCKISFYDETANPLYYADKLYLDGKPVKEMTFPKLTEVKNYTFYNYNGLEKLTIPDTVTKIGKAAFFGCSKLDEVKLGDNVEEIGVSAFERCINLPEIEVPAKTEKILNRAFAKCDILKNVKLNPGLKELGREAFTECYVLPGISLPESLEKIGEYCFSKCYELRQVTVPTTLKTVGKSAFAECGSLNRVIIADLEAWCNIDFLHDQGLEAVDSNPLYYAKDLYVGTVRVVELLVPSSVAKVKDYAFNNCESIRKVKLQSGTTEIGVSAFYHNTNLTKVELSDTVEKLGDHAFDGCSALSDISLGNGVNTLGKYVFRGCKMKEMYLPVGITVVPEGAFMDCTSLKYALVPTGASKVDAMAYAGCKTLRAITLPELLDEIGDSAFAGCTSLAHVLYGGTSTQWKALQAKSIGAGNENLTNMYDQVNNVNGVRFHWSCEERMIDHGMQEEHVPASCTDYGAIRYRCTCKYVWTVSQMDEKPTHHNYVETKCTKCGKSNPYYIKDFKFTDVPKGAWYRQPVMWAVKKNITTGVTSKLFKPNDKCTRAQVVTFLWRAKGSPNPKSTNNPFTDVKSSQYYYKAVLWALENNVTSGMYPNKFGPNYACNRAQVVTFLYNLEGAPETEYANPFTDVQPSDYFYYAVLWATQKGITTGTSATTFTPKQTCTRGQIVTFLYRYAADY